MSTTEHRDSSHTDDPNRSVVTYTRDDILALLPHRDDMLLLDRAELITVQAAGSTPSAAADAANAPEHTAPEPESRAEVEARGYYQVRGDEFFLRGHFPGNPVVPGVIQCEIMGQSACVLVAEYAATKTPYFTGMDRVKFRRKVVPGDLIVARSVLERSKPPFFFIKSEIYVDGALCASGNLSFALM